MKKAHRPVWRPVGPMAVPTFSNKLSLAMKRGRNRRPGTSSSSTAGSRVLKLAVHAEEEDSVSDVSDGNGSDAAVEDDGPIQLLDDLLLQLYSSFCKLGRIHLKLESILSLTTYFLSMRRLRATSI